MKTESFVVSLFQLEKAIFSVIQSLFLCYWSVHILIFNIIISWRRDVLQEPWWRVPGTAGVELTTSSTIPEDVLVVILTTCVKGGKKYRIPILYTHPLLYCSVYARWYTGNSLTCETILQVDLHVVDKITQ